MYPPLLDEVIGKYIQVEMDLLLSRPDIQDLLVFPSPDFRELERNL